MFTHFDRNAKRVGEILAILGRYGLADWLGGLNYEWIQGRLVSFDGERLGKLTQEARIRLALTELGTTFIKLGQMLSTRADLVGPSLATELSQLRSHTPPDPAENDQGHDPARARQTASRSCSPSSTTSRSPPHRSGRCIGPGCSAASRSSSRCSTPASRNKILGDLDIMGVLADLAQKHVVVHSRLINPPPPCANFAARCSTSSTFPRSGATSKSSPPISAMTKPSTSRSSTPIVCSRRVLTMEMLVGISGEDVPGMRGSGFDLNEFAQRGANMYLDMIFRDGFYHADPHPGNLMMLPGGVVGVLDCGMVGRLDETMREEVESLLISIINKDAIELTDAVMRLGSVPAELDRDSLRGEISNFVIEFASRSLRDFNLSAAMRQMTDIVRRYHILLPSRWR